MKNFKINRFWSVVLVYFGIFAFVKWGIPAISRNITELPFPLPTPSTLVFFYMTLVAVALFLLTTFSDEYMEEFMGPVRKFLQGGFGTTPRLVVLILLPMFVGYQAWSIWAPRLEQPASLRIQHPSSNFPKEFEEKHNPFAEPSDAEITTFIGQAMADKVSFIPQVQDDIDVWRDVVDGDHVLDFFAAPPMKKFVAEIKAGKTPDHETAEAALLEKTLFEGRALYAMNCRACHGDSVAGDGPMADGFKLRPINFTDNGTVETIVEGYTFWRVMNGGPGLPTEATPWDSAMPEWKLNLTEDERWKIIMAEYWMAQKTPRIPEGH